MICAHCNKPVDNKTDDWLYYEKSVKHDWKYVIRHRACTDNQQGWQRIENISSKYEAEVERIMTVLNKFKVNEGDFSPAFYGALEKLGLSED